MSGAESIQLATSFGEGDSRRLGPARVVSATAASLRVELPSGQQVAATMALAFPFEPVEGDTLLVIGQDERHYVIGVIASQGSTHLRFRGDVELHAVAGDLNLKAGKGVKLAAPSLLLRSKRMRVLAEKASEVLGSAYTRVNELLSVHSEKSETVVRQEWSTRAERVAVTGEETVAVNGKQIHLG
jgi:hypothetical protein